MQSISLADELTLEPAPPRRRRAMRSICPGVPGAARARTSRRAALRAFRASTGWRAPPLRLSIVKRIPVAAGLGGGSADAAATLRLARHASGLGDEQLLRTLGAQLGADVPAQIAPGRWLATGAGEQLQELAPRAIALRRARAAAGGDAVDGGRVRRGRPTRRWRAPRTRARGAARGSCSAALAHGAPLPAATELLHNDLQRAAVSLCPPIVDALAQAREAGAELALVSGSGPTVLGLFPRPCGTRPVRTDVFAPGRAGAQPTAAYARARGGGEPRGPRPAPIHAAPVDAVFARAVTLGPSADAGSRPRARERTTDDACVRNNPGQDPMSRSQINELVAAGAGVVSLALFAGLILVPAWSSYSRLWERLAATVLSLYVLAVLVGVGVVGALAAVYLWG